MSGWLALYLIGAGILAYLVRLIVHMTRPPTESELQQMTAQYAALYIKCRCLYCHHADYLSHVCDRPQTPTHGLKFR